MPFSLYRKATASKQKYIPSLTPHIEHLYKIKRYPLYKIKRNTSMRLENSCYKTITEQKVQVESHSPFPSSFQDQICLSVCCESFTTQNYYIYFFLSCISVFNTQKRSPHAQLFHLLYLGEYSLTAK